MSDERVAAALAIICPVCEVDPYRPCQQNGKNRELHPERLVAGRPREHRLVCSCGSDWPCDGMRAQHQETNRLNRETARRLRLARIQSGDCLACAGKVTGRTPSYTFSGENVWRADVPAVFHLRRDCLDEARKYDQEWTQAWPRRVRGGPGRVLRLSCGGTLTTHLDGRKVCTAEKDGCGLAEMPQIRRLMPVRHRVQVWCHPGHACETCEPKEPRQGLQVVR